MKKLEQLLKAINEEFGMCPTWKPLIVEAATEYMKMKRYLRADKEVDNAVLGSRSGS